MKKMVSLSCLASLIQLSCGTGIDPNGAFTTAAAPTCAQTLASATPWSGVKQLNVKVTPQAGALDGSSNLLLAGETTGAVNGTLTGLKDLFVIKFDYTGAVAWTQQMGVAGKTTSAYGVAGDSAGNVYVTGNTNGDLDGVARTGSTDLFLIKYDASGTKQWTRLVGVGSGVSRGYGVTVDTSGNVFVAGTTVDGFEGQATASDPILVMKYDSAGTKIWARIVAPTGIGKAASATSIALGPSGSIYLTGETTSPFSGNSITGTRDVFVAKFDSTGTVQWISQFGASSQVSVGHGIAVDSAGNSYVVGKTFGSLPGNTLTGARDLFIAKLNDSGARQWINQLGVAGVNTEVYTPNVALDSSSNVYLSGITGGSLAGVPLTGTFDAVVAKFDPSGARSWLKLMGAASKVTLSVFVQVDCIGNVVIGGSTTGAFSGNTVSDPPVAFVTKLDPSTGELR